MLIKLIILNTIFLPLLFIAESLGDFLAVGYLHTIFLFILLKPYFPIEIPDILETYSNDDPNLGKILTGTDAENFLNNMKNPQPKEDIEDLKKAYNKFRTIEND